MHAFLYTFAFISTIYGLFRIKPCISLTVSFPAAAWGAILSAAGFSTAYVSTCMAYGQSCKDAYDAYWKTYYNSTIL